MSGRHPLDPGAPSRKRGSFLKFCIYTGLTLIGIILSMLLYAWGSAVWENLSHSRVYWQDDQVTDPSSVVRPLVDENQRFDIAVTIWAPFEHEEYLGHTEEKPIYSDIVFRDLRLADKHKSVNLTYKLPLAMFKRYSFYRQDLRASFVLIPTSPSLMDKVSDFSSVRSDAAYPWAPVRSWPFPLGAADSGPKTIADEALDSFGISMPLLELHAIGSKCPESYGTQSDDDDDEEFSDIAPADMSNIVFYPKHAIERHPFVVTRTQIRVVDETHLFDRKLYNQEHRNLRSTSSRCGEGAYRGTEDLEQCARTYVSHGNWETRLALQVADGEPEYAYAPYMGYAAAAAGPKDLVQIPVSREICDYDHMASKKDPGFMDVNWQLSYSGRSPLKFFAADQIVQTNRVSFNETECKTVKAQESAELWNGLVGHRYYEDAHPRRRLFLISLLYILSSVDGMLTSSYWYTRTSTVGISVSGALLLVISQTFGVIVDSFSSFDDPHDGLADSTERLLWVASHLVMCGIALLWPFFILRTIVRLSFTWNGWLPSMSRAAPNHQERASQRLDARTSWVLKAAVCITLIALDYTLEPFDYPLISALHPTRGPTDAAINPTHFVAKAYLSAWFPLKLTGTFSQILLNYHAKTFAGAYKLTIAVGCVYEGLHLLLYVPSFVGRYDARPGFTVLMLLDCVMLGVLVCQAVLYPKVTPKMEGEEE